jgi:hypothetical protein
MEGASRGELRGEIRYETIVDDDVGRWEQRPLKLEIKSRAADEFVIGFQARSGFKLSANIGLFYRSHGNY